MGLDEFERELAAQKDVQAKHRSHHRHDNQGDRRHRKHHDRSEKDESDRRQDGKHRHRRKRDDEPNADDERDRKHRKRRRSTSRHRHPECSARESKRSNSEGEDEWVEKETTVLAPSADLMAQRDPSREEFRPKRDAWMQEPSAMDIEYIRSRKPKEPEGQFVSAKQDHSFKPNKDGMHDHLADLERDLASDDDETKSVEAVGTSKLAQHEVSYVFGDSGSSWRMTKLKAVYRRAEENGKPVEEVALERYTDLREFDDAREEERELDRREVYGPEYVGLEKPSGELFQERKMEAGIRSSNDDLLTSQNPDPLSDDRAQASVTTVPLDSTALNKLKAEMLKAKMRNASNAAALDEQYEIAANAAAANSIQPDVIVLNKMENRQLAGGREGEVTNLTNKRGRERGLVEENEDMSIEDMVRQERRSRGMAGSEGRAFAERIAKDSKFTDDLEYMDENATKLSKRVVKSDINLRNMAISDFQKMQKVLDSCALCYHEDTNKPPIAPVVSLATRTYLTLPTEPEIAKGGAVIVPIQHRLNLLECDDDEWEEIRNFMKSLTRYYHAMDKSVIFYENAAYSSSRKGHAALNAIPLPHDLAENGPAYFKEAILVADEQWTQHKPIIDTIALSQKPGYGRTAFRKAIPKEMPYFHVFFTIDGGLGHVIEDERRWPKGDLFAREIIGGMLDRGPEIIKKQGRWEKGDRRVEGFRKKWAKFDWTAALVDAA